MQSIYWVDDFVGLENFQHIEYRMEMNSLSFFGPEEFYFFRLDQLWVSSLLNLPFSFKWSPASINQPIILRDLFLKDVFLFVSLLEIVMIIIFLWLLELSLATLDPPDSFHHEARRIIRLRTIFWSVHKWTWELGNCKLSKHTLWVDLAALNSTLDMEYGLSVAFLLNENIIISK